MKRANTDNFKTAFILGSPRSGTTILENVLNCHPEIAEWYEPYYLWEHHFSCAESDVWPGEQLTEKVRAAIHREFRIFARKAGKPIVLDKYPYHAFNFLMIYRIFPDAKWIHILRDGRDVTLSLYKEWLKRTAMVTNRDFKQLFLTARDMLGRQRYFRHKLMAVSHEIRSNASFNPLLYLNKSRWKGKAGYGPRFTGWNEIMDQYSPLQFVAMQWVKSVEAVRANWAKLPEENRIEIRYEDFLNSPEEVLKEILQVLEVDCPFDFFRNIPNIKRNNFSKWGRGFSPFEISEFKPVLAPLLEELGYAGQDEW
jgi:hypothetical protein